MNFESLYPPHVSQCSFEQLCYVEQEPSAPSFEQLEENKRRPNIYTTTSGGRLHLAFDENYLGSVRHYDTFLSRFFAWIMGWSMTVKIATRKYVLDREGYATLISRLSDTDGKAQDAAFDHVARNSSFSFRSTKRMQNEISRYDSHALGIELAHALAKKDEEAAIQLIGKGADLETKYFDRGEFGISFGKCDTGLWRHEPIRFDAFEGTSILHASRKNLTKVVQAILKWNPKAADSQGQTLSFNRKVTRRTSIEMRHFVTTYRRRNGRLAVRRVPYTAPVGRTHNEDTQQIKAIWKLCNEGRLVQI